MNNYNVPAKTKDETPTLAIDPSKDKVYLSIDEIQESSNLTDAFISPLDNAGKSTYLTKIAQRVINGYKVDKRSLKEWETTINEAMDMAKQAMDTKTFPWPNSSNIKYPLIIDAAIEFASIMRPEIIPNSDKIVHTRIQGKDPDGSKYERSARVSSCMSYQQLSSPDWKQGVDRSLKILSIVGTIFKKIYYSEEEKRNISELCCPDEVVVNYNTKSLDSCRRITHITKMSINDVIERQRRGTFNKNVSIEELRPEGCDPDDDDFEIELLEQHCWWDFDGDGYKEPYVIIIHERSLNVLKIVSRIDSIEYNKEKEIVCIKADQYFQDYHFIHSPDGGFYSIGYGQLLLPLNKAINSVFNQLIDSGTIHATQGGFIGKGLRLRDGEYRFKPFEWKTVDIAGSDLAKNIFPFPVKEPSSTLFNLLTLMIEISKDITSSTEASQGKLSGSNVSEGTMNSIVEQSSKRFVAIYQRFMESMAGEFQKLYKLNYYHLTNREYRQILDDETADKKQDFNLDDCDVRPVADPTISTMGQRLQKINMLMGLRTVNPQVVDMYTLKTLQYDDEQIKEFMTPPPPQEPSAEDQKDLAAAKEAMARAENLSIQSQIAIAKAPLEVKLSAKQIDQTDSQIQESVARVWKMTQDNQHTTEKLAIAGAKMQQQETLKQFQAKHNQEKDTLAAIQKEKEINIKGAEAAADAALENKKLDIMREKQNNGTDRSE